MKFMYLLATVTVHGQVVAQEPGEKFQKNQQQRGTDLCTDLCWMLFLQMKEMMKMLIAYLFLLNTECQ